jgi:nucleoside-diphosphate-sugar epimerase
MTVLVTGASGFLGTALCSAWRDREEPVRALVRHEAAAPPGTTAAIAADICDAAAIGRAVNGVDTVVHLAGRAHVLRERTRDPLAAFRAVNVEGTRILLEAANAAGVRRFIFASSVKAVGDFNAVPWTEEEPARPTDPYGVSKLEAEGLVLDPAVAGRMAASVLRLPLSYGAGAKANILRLFDLVARRVPLPFGGVRNRRSLLYTGNLVAAIDAVRGSPNAAGQMFFVSDDADLSTPELLRLIGRALDVRARLVAVPAALFRVLLPRALERRLIGSLAVDIGKLREVTGYAPPYTPEQGLAEMGRWYLTRGRG